MTGRDRTVLIVVVVLAVLGAGWMLVVSPERKQADKLGAQVTEAKSQLEGAESKLANARSAQAQYASAYTSIVNLGKAVPPSQEVPSLIYQLAQASEGRKVDFTSITNGATAAAASAPGGSSATAAAAAAGFSQMPFTFVFEGSFFDLEHLFQGVNRFTRRTTSGALDVNGRLLTIQSLKLAAATNASAPVSHGRVAPTLAGTVTATAYVLPASQGLTGSAAAPGAAPASQSGSGASSPTAPAVARVTP